MPTTPNLGFNIPTQGTVPWDSLINGNFSSLDSLLSSGTSVPSLALSGALTKVNNVPTVGPGVAAIVAKADATAQAANIGLTTLYTVPASGAGMYRISAYAVVTQAATTSSTLPNVQVSFTDNDTGITGLGPYSFTGTNTGNSVGASNSIPATPAAESAILNAKASTNIQYATTGYASSGATPMQYAVHIKLEYLGP
jgi:hypothetical protein